MKKTLLTLLGLFALFSLARTLSAQVPTFINYQGTVLEEDNDPFPDGDYQAQFRIWDAPVDGNLIWSEQQTIKVRSGRFNVSLGEGSSIGGETPSVALIKDAFGGADRYLGLTVIRPGFTPAEFSPRQRFLSGAFAFNAVNAENAIHAVNADDATNAVNAIHAVSADDATNAVNAINTENATNAVNATTATSLSSDRLTIETDANDRGILAFLNNIGGIGARIRASFTDDEDFRTLGLYNGADAPLIEVTNSGIDVLTASFKSPIGNTAVDITAFQNGPGLVSVRGPNNSRNVTMGSFTSGLHGLNRGLIQVFNENGTSVGFFTCTDNGSGLLRLFRNSPPNTETIRLDGNLGSINISGAYSNTSDRRYKKNIETIENSLEGLMAVRPVTFNWNEASGSNQDETQYGFIAQEVEEIFPEFVQTAEEDGKKSLSYNSFIPLLVDAVQRQQAMIEELQSELEALRQAQENR